MRSAVLTLLLAVASSGAAAAWIEVGGNEVTATYADSDTIRRIGSVVKMWHLVDYAKARQFNGIRGYQSVSMYAEYDCALARERTLDITLHSGNMGTGEVLGRVTGPDTWRPIRADTLVETLRGFACGIQ